MVALHGHTAGQAPAAASPIRSRTGGRETACDVTSAGVDAPAGLQPPERRYSPPPATGKVTPHNEESGCIVGATLEGVRAARDGALE